MNRVIVPLRRFLSSLRRPSKTASARRLRARGETSASIVIREATAADIPALARLHVTTFRETHGGGPPLELRESQYREKFAGTDGSWFCFVAVRQNGDLVGFAVGDRADPPAAEGYVNKIYVRRDYQRLGLGRRLVAHLAERFLSQGYSSMTLFSQAENPSIWFFDAIGGERLVSPAGEFHGGYRFRNLPDLRDMS